MKKIFTLFVLLNVIVLGNVNAQTNRCNINYSAGSITYAPDSFYLGTDVPFINYGDMSGSIPIGFTFNYFGNDYTQIVSSPDGYATFDNTMANQTCNLSQYHLIGIAPPMTGYPSNSIFLYVGYFTTGVVTGTSSIRYNTTGTAPYRKFIISYDSIEVYYHIGCFVNDYFTGEIILYETTNIIETHIKHAPSPGCYSDNATLEGVQNIGGTVGTGSADYQGASNEGMRYTSYTFPFSGLPICIVSVDSATGKNMIVWDQPAGVPVDSFVFYRETSQTNVYAQIGNQAGSAFSTFIDTGSNPAVQSNRYEMGFVDSCGNYTYLSGAQKTIHLMVNQGMNNSWNLSWDAYEGFTFATYYIYRGPAPDSLTLFATVASNIYSYTDLTPTNPVYYAIEVTNPGGCNPSARMESGNSSSMSNIFNPDFTGINELNELNSISIYPNPANSGLNIRFNSNKNIEMIFSNVLGEDVYHQSISNATQSTIDISKWSEGVYFYRITNGKETLRGKFVKQ